MVLQSVSLLIQYNVSRYWDLSPLLIHAFADGDGNPSMTSVDPEGKCLYIFYLFKSGSLHVKEKKKYII